MKTDYDLTFRMSLRSAAVLVFLAAASPALAGPGQPGHGHGDMPKQGHMMEGMKMGGQESPGHHGGMAAIGEPGKAAEVTRTIDITMQDNFYEPENITVAAGETIRFKITNKGAYLHEFGLGTAAMHAEHQKQMMTMMEHGMIEADRINPEKMKMDHGGGHMMNHDDPNSILLEPGKSGEIIWKFTKPTKLEFACNIPGHYESGMMGKIRFK